jgi:hypothetical protein
LFVWFLKKREATVPQSAKKKPATQKTKERRTQEKKESRTPLEKKKGKKRREAP